MSAKAELKREKIRGYIGVYYKTHDDFPTVRDIAAGTGIPFATVHRYLTAMQESGEVEYEGRRSASTPLPCARLRCVRSRSGGRGAVSGIYPYAGKPCREGRLLCADCQG